MYFREAKCEKCDTCPTDVCGLKWWAQHVSKFPYVAKLSKKYLAIPATSTASERVFSTAGNIVNKKRAA